MIRPSGLMRATSDQLEAPLRLSWTTWGADAGRATVLAARAPMTARRENRIFKAGQNGRSQERQRVNVSRGKVSGFIQFCPVQKRTIRKSRRPHLEESSLPMAPWTSNLRPMKTWRSNKKISRQCWKVMNLSAAAGTLVWLVDQMDVRCERKEAR